MMALWEQGKRIVEKATGWARPNARELADLVRPRKPRTSLFRDDGIVPNNPRWPLVSYRGAVKLPKPYDPAGVLEAVFESNGWGECWRDGIYDYVHYHPSIHEVLGVARGTASVRFGGGRGRVLHLKAGDVVILPAGTGHECLFAELGFAGRRGLSTFRHLR